MEVAMRRTVSEDKIVLVLVMVMLFQALFIGIVKTLGPSVIPIGFWDLWKTKGDLGAAVLAYWPVFAWGLALQSVLIAIARSAGLLDASEHSPAKIFAAGTSVSVRAGVTEEIIFRWLGFLAAIATVKFFNVILFGLVAWISTELLLPLADFVTFGKMHAMLFSEHGWWYGAAILTANAWFRDGHKASGFLGWVNSWCLGMVLFHCAFTYGLLPAIIVHALYDVCVFAAAAAFLPQPRWR
jgi:hypothetical protein